MSRPYMRGIYHRSRAYAAPQNVADYEIEDDVAASVVAQAINRVAYESTVKERANLILRAADRARVKHSDLIAAIEGSINHGC